MNEKYNAVAAAARKEIWKCIGNGASSAAVAVLAEGEVVYNEAFGIIDREAGVPADIGTQYNIGSISKTITAITVLQLCERGLLELDRPLCEYLPDFYMRDERYKQITVRMLLNHSSALSAGRLSDRMSASKDRQYSSRVLDELRSNSLLARPGKRSVYCNSGYTVAEVLVEQISGMSYQK